MCYERLGTLNSGRDVSHFTCIAPSFERCERNFGAAGRTHDLRPPRLGATWYRGQGGALRHSISRSIGGVEGLTGLLGR